MNLIEPIINADSFEEGENVQEVLSESNLKYAEAFLSTGKLLDGLKIEVLKAVVDGVIVEHYEAIVTSRFSVNGELHLMTVDGHVLNVSRMLAELRSLKETLI